MEFIPVIPLAALTISCAASPNSEKTEKPLPLPWYSFLLEPTHPYQTGACQRVTKSVTSALAGHEIEISNGPMTSPSCSYQTDGFCILCNFRSLFMAWVRIIQEAKKLPRKIDLEPVQRLKIILLIRYPSLHRPEGHRGPSMHANTWVILACPMFWISKQDRLWRVNGKDVWSLDVSGTRLGTAEQGPATMDRASGLFELDGYLFSPYTCWLHIRPSAQLRDSEEVCFKQARQEVILRGLVQALYQNKKIKHRFGWLAENIGKKVMFKTKSNLNVFRERDHKLIYSLSKKLEEFYPQVSAIFGR